MGGDSHGHHELKVPCYKIYEIKNAPELVNTQKALAAKGLCDPWLRNEVWRFERKHWGTEASRVRTVLMRGMVIGVAAFAVTVIGSTVYSKMNPSDHHGHGEHESSH